MPCPRHHPHQDGCQGDDREDRDGRRRPRPHGERSTGVVDELQLEETAETARRVERIQVALRKCLGDLVKGQATHSDCGRRDPPHRQAMTTELVTQCRSSRCLHRTHIVARGKADNLAFPIGLPQLSQVP